MKRIYLGLMAGLALMACNRNTDARYLDINTGDSLAIMRDSATGAYVDAQTGKPTSAIFVDTRSRDTIYGPSGKVVNGYVQKDDHGVWVVKENGDELKAKAEDGSKVKSEGDEYKEKSGSYTRKVDGDGDVKIETGNKTIKIDGETGERKVKKDHNITDKVKKVFH